MFQNDCTLLISSCDKYASAWKPYFDLICANWKGHPQKIVLNTETLQFSHDELEIRCINGGKNATWSRRLYDCLEKIETKYIIFSLEDFFLQAPIDQERVEQCYRWMEENGRIAVFRLCASDLSCLTEDGAYEGFRLATNRVPYRLETQLALWNRQTLMGFIDVTESPWQFEGRGTRRIMDTEKLFYWYYMEEPGHISNQMIVPYLIGCEHGYGINWGKWLWNNGKLFDKYGIKADFSELGVLSEAIVRFRLKTVYNAHSRGIYRILKPIVSLYLKWNHLFSALLHEGPGKVIKLIHYHNS